MARPLRILMAGGWDHVASRGNRREALFLTDADRKKFLGLVADLPERFRVEVHSGAETAPGWLETGTIAAGCGGRFRGSSIRRQRQR